MGRGLGQLQKQILAVVNAPDFHSATIGELTVQIHGEDYSDTQRRNVARAVAALAARRLLRSELSADRFREAVTDVGSAVIEVHPDLMAHLPAPTTGWELQLRRSGWATVQVTEERRVPIPERVVFPVQKTTRWSHLAEP